VSSPSTPRPTTTPQPAATPTGDSRDTTGPGWDSHRADPAAAAGALAEIVEVVSKSPPTKPLILACRPVSVDGAVVTLASPKRQSFFKDVAERRRSILEDGVSRVLGLPVSVRCVAANVEVSPLPEDPDSTRLLTEFRRIYGEDVVDVGDVG